MGRTLENIRAEQNRVTSEVSQHAKDGVLARLRPSGPIGPPTGAGRPDYGTGLANWDSNKPRSDEGVGEQEYTENTRESAIQLHDDNPRVDHPDISGMSHEGERSRPGGDETPTLPDQFHPRASPKEGKSVELPDNRLENAGLYPPAADPASLPSQPLAPQAMAPSDPSQLTSFMTKFLHV